jgi:hypothetical protein
MRYQLFLSALAVSSILVACAADTGSNNEDPAQSDESEADLTAAAKQLTGDWKNDDGSLDAFELRSDGTFIHDQMRVLNGVLVNDPGAPPFGRDSGHFSVSKKNGTVTLHITAGWHSGSTEVLSYSYTAAPILNGVFLPGHEPAAKLVLTQQPAPGSHVAYLPKHYTHKSSFCVAVGAECVALSPSSCKGGEIKDARNFSCGGGLGVECCQK